MNLDFNVDNIRKNCIELLDCQVELILKSLEFYMYTYGFIYPRNSEHYQSEEEDLRISLVKDTYSQINTQFVESKNKEPLEDDIEVILKKYA